MPREKQKPRLREVSLRPRSVSLTRRGQARRHPAGGSAEVLTGKSRLDRFLEAKLEPKRQSVAKSDRARKPSDADQPAEGLKEFGRLGDTPESVKPEPAEISRLPELNADNIVDAIVYAEILGKPVGLRCDT